MISDSEFMMARALVEGLFLGGATMLGAMIVYLVIVAWIELFKWAFRAKR